MRPSALFLAAVCARPLPAESQGHRSPRAWSPSSFVVTAPTGEELVAESALPKSWDWRNVGGRSLVLPAVNQHIPQYCASCYVHGTVGALNDRIKIQRGGAFPDVMLARQVLIDCVPGPSNSTTYSGGCNGGQVSLVHDYLTKNRIPDDTCKPYLARQMKCEEKCMNCYTPATAKEMNLTDACFSVPHWTGYGVSNHGVVKGEVAMMKEIYARGPIVCQFATDDEFMLNFSQNALQNEGVYATRTKFNSSQIDHDMSVAGWGETATGRKFWIIRNSWGTYWGSAGWLLLERGTNQMLIESEHCYWATPTSDELDLAVEGRVWGDYVSGAQLLPDGETAGVAVPVLVGMSMGLAAGTGLPAGGAAGTALASCVAIFGMALGVVGLTRRARSKRSNLLNQQSLLG